MSATSLPGTLKRCHWIEEAHFTAKTWQKQRFDLANLEEEDASRFRILRRGTYLLRFAG